MKERSEPEKSKKEVYQEAYDASKEGGESFFPYTLVKDAIMALVVVGGIIALAVLVPPTLEPPADPTSTTYNPRPEWYFLFFFQFLKLFPGSMEALAAIIIPLVVLALLALLPFLDRGLERRWSRRKGMIGIGLVAVILFVGLEVAGATSAPAQPAGEESREVQMGREVYQEINCAYCHTIDGVGGNLGPDLSGVGGQLGTDEIRVYLQNPNRMVPASLHPNLLFTEEEMDALVAYLVTLGATIEYSDQASIIFDQNCASCHMIEGQGGTLGPDLSAVGGHRSVNFLAAFTANPKAVLPGATMPAYKDVLSEAQISDIAAYLASQRGQGDATPPTSETPEPDVEVGTAPAVPHSLENREDCLTCHATGAFKPYPENHVGRGVENCLSCHQTDE
jgi:sulfur oxidation c-type cytochrome SoxX